MAPTRTIRRASTAVLLAAVAGIAVRRSFVDVAGPSMLPTLWPGDRLVTIPAHRAWLRPGQVVVLEDPADPSHLVIKRLTAVDGGRVEVRGDDPDHSTDGRLWGPLPASSVRRIAVTRWPQVLSPLGRR
ncbi:MAG: nickel-type superoxide dismutase maturation protease [Intrasporangiaceae bacterium]|nr:nickel-type superoxide dismutase maturation protease [Intrasporangiaceae bacterium]